MDGMFVGLIAFLVSSALLVVGCHIGIYLEHNETIVEKRPTQPKNRNRDVDEIVSSVLQTQRWPISRNEFRGFNSPPGHF